MYDDGEVEQLLLANEKWEVIDSSKAQRKVLVCRRFLETVAQPFPDNKLLQEQNCENSSVRIIFPRMKFCAKYPRIGTFSTYFLSAPQEKSQ